MEGFGEECSHDNKSGLGKMSSSCSAIGGRVSCKGVATDGKVVEEGETLADEEVVVGCLVLDGRTGHRDT